MSDRTLGYVVIIGLLLLALLIFSYLGRIDLSAAEVRIFAFDQVGSLALQDPVRMSGVEVGTVHSMLVQNDSIYVQVIFSVPVLIRTSSSVKIVVKGIMGDRFIEISPGEEDSPLVEKSEIIVGDFELGPVEVLAYLDKLQETVTRLKDIIVVLYKGTDNQKSMILRFEEITTSIDSLLGYSVNVFSNIAADLNPALEWANTYLDHSLSLTTSLSGTIPKVTGSVDTIIGTTNSLIMKVESVLSVAEPVVSRLSSEQHGFLESLENVRQQLQLINKSADELRHEGLEFPVKLKF